MMCCEPAWGYYEIQKVRENRPEAFGECPVCGSETIDGESTNRCGYSPIDCEKCGYAPCDGSC